MFDISNINLERVFIFQRYIIAILILLPALIIGYLMLEFNKLFTQKIAPIIRLLYIVSLSFMTAIFEANKFPVEYILIIIAGFLGVIGITRIDFYVYKYFFIFCMVDFQYNVMHIFLSYKKPDFVKLLNPIDFYINTLLVINRIFYIKLF